MKKIFPVFLALLLICPSFLVADGSNVLPLKDRDERMRRIFTRGNITNQASDDVRLFKFDAALERYLETTQAKYLNDAKDESDGLWRMANLYLKLGNYDEVERIYQWHDDHGMGGEFLREKRENLNARITWKETGNKKQVYDFIEVYKKAHKAFIPPKRAGATEMATVAELYDLIGDYDAGIQWAKMFKKKSHETKKEYDQLIQAFEESKQGQPKVCSEDGKYCVGRATAVIIRSKYF